MLFSKFCRKNKKLKVATEWIKSCHNQYWWFFNQSKVETKSMGSQNTSFNQSNSNQMVVEIAYYVRNILVNKQVLIQK